MSFSRDISDGSAAQLARIIILVAVCAAMVGGCSILGIRWVRDHVDVSIEWGAEGRGDRRGEREEGE